MWHDPCFPFLTALTRLLDILVHFVYLTMSRVVYCQITANSKDCFALGWVTFMAAFVAYTFSYQTLLLFERLWDLCFCWYFLFYFLLSSSAKYEHAHGLAITANSLFSASAQSLTVCRGYSTCSINMLSFKFTIIIFLLFNFSRLVVLVILSDGIQVFLVIDLYS